MSRRGCRVGHRVSRGVAAALFLLGIACSDEDDGPGGPVDGGGGDTPVSADGPPDAVPNALTISGRVVRAGTSTGVARALVTVSIDVDGNGVVDSNERQETTTTDMGSYVVVAPVKAGQTAVVKIAQPGLAPIFRTIDAKGGAGVQLDTEMAATAPMTCAAGKCSGDTRGVSLEGVPDGTQASGMAFNPVTDTDKFPGAFDESTGALLKSAVFAAIELKDASGTPLTTFAAPVSLLMAVPADTWSIITDVTAGTDRIEVPLYSFDEKKGTWVADGQGYLQDAAGMPIPEATLAQIRARTYSGSVTAKGAISHASYWNVDWPLRTHGCITGTVVDQTGLPVAGATLFAGGVDYTASYRPQTTSSSGAFCLDVLRAEGAGEDVDGNGTMGDKHQVALHVSAQQALYLLGSFTPGATEAVCGGTCTDVGMLALIPAKEVETALEGHWAGDWGDMVLRKVGDEYWGVYLHDTGTVVLRRAADGVYRGWWSEVPSREPPNDAGEVEFRFAWTGTALSLDGQWRYGVTGAFKADWDLAHVTTPVPAGLEERFADVASFKRHP
jgi:hypothetical protein